MQQICLAFGLCGKSGSVSSLCGKSGSMSHAPDSLSFEDLKGKKREFQVLYTYQILLIPHIIL